MKTLRHIFLGVMMILLSANIVLGNARVQVIHNSADAAAEMVDVWLDNTLLLDNFEFRTASPFVDAPAGVEFTIAIKGPDSQDPIDPIWSQNYTLEDGKTYVLVANGIVSPSGYDPATPFDIYVYDMGREEACMTGNTDVLVFHGSTDAPTVDVVETGIGAGTIVDNIMYGDFQGYLELPADDYVLDVRDESGQNTVAQYAAPLETLGLQDAALVTVASGFLNPDNNSGGPAFGLWVALPSGGNLVELPVVTAVDEYTISDDSFRVYPNPTTGAVNVNFNLMADSNVSVYVYDMTGNVVQSASYGNISRADHNLKFNMNNLTSGLYFVTVQAGNSILTKKVQLIN